jgi:hypothetical protein
MPNNSPKQTPFDDLVPGTRPAPQPVSSPPPPNNTLPLAGRTNAPATRVVAALQDDPDVDDDTSTYNSTATGTPRRIRRRPPLPLGTIVGLAMVGGAFIVLALSALFMRVMPREKTRALPPPITNGTRTSTMPEPDPETLSAAEAADAARRARHNGDTAQVPAGNNEAGSATINEAPASAIPSDERDTDSTTDRGDQTNEASSDTPIIAPGNGRGDSDEDDSQDQRSATRSSATRGSDDNDGRSSYRHDGTGYRVKPPSGFRLQKSGRRTVWSGPGGSQFLVETSNSPGSSPRADWEQLDKALAKKYGYRYRSHGIRETTLAGRPAAVWEFEIGNTRKVDVAVHHRGKGYAVLAEAPAEEFENLRPQLESAIRSFELPAKSKRRSSRTDSRHEDSSGDDRDGLARSGY